MLFRSVIDEAGRIGLLASEWGQKGVDEPEHAASTDGLLPTATKRGLIGGHLPGVHYASWDERAEAGQEIIAFGIDGEPEQVHVAIVRGDEWSYWNSSSHKETDEGSEFFEALAAFHRHWRRVLDPAMDIDVPEPRLVDASLAGLARSMQTFVGDHPKYGLGHYAEPMHDSFPPTILWMTNACLEWGLLERADAYLTYYFEHFVRDDGTFEYYGPAVSEYGQMLDLVARFVQYTGDDEWLGARRAKVDAIARHLIALRHESLAQPADSQTRGLLFGSPEADTREDTDYYFSGTAWACRGLMELGRLYEERQLPSQEILGEAEGIRQDLLVQARASLIACDPPFLPPYPGIGVPFETMTSGTLGSYTNYRYWPELLAAEVLDEDLQDAVFEYRRRMGGELLATTRFARQLDDWPLAPQVRALLADDRIEQYLLALYGHMALQQMPGTFCAYEQVRIEGAPERRYHADYCVPAQLTTPLMVKWMLVSEERDAERVWLCKAAPQRWFEPGEYIEVRNAPTRWGKISFRIDSYDDRVEAQVIPPDGFQGEVVLRIRRADRAPVEVSGPGTGIVRAEYDP